MMGYLKAVPGPLSIVQHEYLGTALHQLGQCLGDAMQVWLVSHIVAALAAGSRGGAERDGEAAVLVTMVLEGPLLLAGNQLAVFGQCLCAVLEGCTRGLTPQAVGNLLACFDVTGFAARLLDGGGHSGLPRPQASQPDCSLSSQLFVTRTLSLSCSAGCIIIHHRSGFNLSVDQSAMQGFDLSAFLNP